MVINIVSQVTMAGIHEEIPSSSNRLSYKPDVDDFSSSGRGGKFDGQERY